MTRKELEKHVQGLADHTLTAEQFADLQTELRNNPASREFYRRSMDVENLLIETLGNQIPQSTSSLNVQAFLKRRQRKFFYQALVSAAAILVIAAIALTLITAHRSQPDSLSWKVAEGTHWSVVVQGEEPESKDLKSIVVEGSTVSVQSGSLRLKDDTGVVMLISGPAEVYFPKLDRPLVQSGWLWIDSSGSSEPFEVETPQLHVKDIGTRFGIRARENGESEVHLIEGIVEITPKNSTGKPLLLKPTDQGLFISAKGATGELPLAPDPFPGLPGLLAQEAGYRTTILSQTPTGYWSLNEKNTRKLTNEIPGGIEGILSQEAVTAEAGVGIGDIFRGFGEDNRSIFLPGSEEKSVLYNLDIPDGISREEGAISFWIRRTPGNDRREILWLAGAENNDSPLPPATSMMHVQLTDSGRVEFFVENGRFDLRLSSNFSVVDDQWHHIAASWEPSAVELYVDGRRVQRIDDFSSLQQGTLRGRSVRFGKPSIKLKNENAKPFTGWVDEIAVWRRPLDSIEVAHQYQAAKGKTDPD